MEAIAKACKTDIKEFADLRTGLFHYKTSEMPPVKVRIPTKTLGYNWAMNKDEWQKLVSDQLKTYYSEICQKTPAKEVDTPPETKVGDFAGKEDRKPLFDL